MVTLIPLLTKKHHQTFKGDLVNEVFIYFNLIFFLQIFVLYNMRDLLEHV